MFKLVSNGYLTKVELVMDGDVKWNLTTYLVNENSELMDAFSSRR